MLMITFGDGEVMLKVLRCQLTQKGQVVTNAEARFNNSLRPRKPEGSLGRTAQDGHLDSHKAPELWKCQSLSVPGAGFIERLERRLRHPKGRS